MRKVWVFKVIMEAILMQVVVSGIQNAKMSL